MSLIYLAGVSTLKYDESKCRNCGRCVEVCPHGVFIIENKKAKVVNKDACIECGACQMNCQFEAITVNAGVGCASALLNAKPGESGTCGGEGCNCG
jgi:NAD-dependent dihydropyrimidine dehydrogenase PreA subunit